MNLDAKIKMAHEIDMMVVGPFRPLSDQMWDEFNETTAARPEKGDTVVVNLHGLVFRTRIIFAYPDGSTFMIQTHSGYEKVGLHQIVSEGGPI